MENQTGVPEEASLNSHPQIALIDTFCEITNCPSKSESLFFLESHNFDLDAAVSTFLDDTIPAAVAGENNPNSPVAHNSPHYQPSDDSSSPSSYRSRSPSPPPAVQSYNLRSSAKPNNSGGRRSRDHCRDGINRGVRTLADLNRNPKEDDSDSDSDFDPQEYYTGGEKSGMLVQDPTRRNDVNAIFDQARRSGSVGEPSEHLLPSSSRTFSGTGRLLSGGTSSNPQPNEAVNHEIVFWRNGFTVDDGPLRSLDDPENASFLESVKRGECPVELAPADKLAPVHVNLTRREENYQEAKKPRLPFQGVGKTLGSTSDDVTNSTAPTTTSTTTTTTGSTSSQGLVVVDESQPCTCIQLRLADGTRVVSRFNNIHTVRDIRAFIDASSSRSSAPRNYQLQVMGFPPKQLDDLDQTIDQAGIANSVVIQKL